MKIPIYQSYTPLYLAHLKKKPTLSCASEEETQNTSMDEDVLYVVDETKGVLWRYNSSGDCWEELIQSVHLKGVVQIAADRGNVCAIRSYGCGIAVVDVVARPSQLWVVDPPPALQAIVVHILPRITRPVP
uniref:F-box/kelch-repeat protein SKIP25-like n=1 Tax=Nelumbo nucifera TaxID=4432 RepID=A0A822Y3W1_NELNU|nr:TPA_asm: hypothetical protein HUJ06_027202 [Nelumbo nucifera]